MMPSVGDLKDVAQCLAAIAARSDKAIFRRRSKFEFKFDEVLL
jgi:hypothetical protein